MASPASHNRVRPGTDVNSFFNRLQRNGNSVGTTDLREASLDRGWAICNEFDPGMTNRQIGHDLMRHSHTPRDAAVWVFASVSDMRPEYTTLLG